MTESDRFRNLVAHLAEKTGDAAVFRLQPSDRAAPEHMSQQVSARFSPATTNWPDAGPKRPLMMFPPRPLSIELTDNTPSKLYWDGGWHAVERATRLDFVEPEWWLANTDWHTGPRQYWRLDTFSSYSFFAYYASGAQLPADWFCEGWF